MLLAQVDLLGVLNLIVQGGSFALLAFMIVRGMPQLYQKISADQSLERTEFTKALAQERADQSLERNEFMAALAQDRKEALAALGEKRREFLEAQQKQRDDFVGVTKELSQTFRAEASAERVACEKHFEALAGTMSESSKAMMAAFRAMAEQMQGRPPERPAAGKRQGAD